MFTNLFESWTNNEPNQRLKHGIPQGPEPSNFFAEFYLLPLDNIELTKTKYFRYVDDIYLLSKNPHDLHNSLILIEDKIKEMGLILNVSKYKIDVHEDTGKFIKEIGKLSPSLFDIAFTKPNLTRRQRNAIDKMFEESICKRKGSYTIENKTIFKCTTFNVTKGNKTIKALMTILEQHPFLAENIISATCTSNRSRKIYNALVKIALKPQHHEDYEAYLWKGLSYHNYPLGKDKLCRKAWARLSGRNSAKSILLRSQLYSYLIINKYRQVELFRIFEGENNPFVSVIIGFLIQNYESTANIEAWASNKIKSDNLSQALTAASYYIKHSLQIRNVGNMNHKTQEVLKAEGIIQRRAYRRNEMNEVLERRYNVNSPVRWQQMMPAEHYRNLLGLLRIAAMKKGIKNDDWILTIDSVNHILISLMCSKSFSGRVVSYKIIKYTFVDHMGVDYGQIIRNTRGILAKFPGIIPLLKEIHDLRGEIKGIHPIVRRTMKPVKGVPYRKVKKIYRKINHVYQEIVNELR